MITLDRDTLDLKQKLAIDYSNLVYAGKWYTTARESLELASFGESDYDHNDAQGFINLFGLPIGVTAMVHNRDKEGDGPAAEMRNMAATFHKE